MASLFTTAELRKPEARPERATTAGKPPAHVRATEAVPSTFLICPARAELKKLIDELRPDHQYEYATGGRWSAHELLQFVLEQTGPAEVSIATWTLTEEPCRVLHRLLAEGKITRMTLLLDNRIKSRCPQAFQLATTLPSTTIHLVRSHAKVTTIENAQWGVSIVSSQNYTRNPRIEAGQISTVPASAAFHRRWIADEVAGNQPFTT